MAFTVREGWLISSIKYSSRKDGRAKNRRIIAGNTVQTVSISWASRMFRQENFEVSNANVAYVTTDKIMQIISIAWS